MKKESKKILGIVALALLFMVLAINGKPEEKMYEKLSINGDSFALLLDDEVTTTIPSTGAYLVGYTCDNGSKITWNRETGEISLSKNTSVTENCTLTFKTNPLVSELPQGSYIAYQGNNGCLRNGETKITLDGALTTDYENSNSCFGYNANANADGSKDSTLGVYGYCYSSSHSYYVNGWRIAYTDDGRAHIVSAGAPECNTRPNSANGNTDYITAANISAKKYCNSNFVDDCTSDTDIHAINDTDFNKMTAQITGTNGGYLYTSIVGATKCGGEYSKEVCGYNNDLIDNGGFYWFAAAYTSTSTDGVGWYPNFRSARYYTYAYGSDTYAYGLRPVIRLSADVFVTDGSGTMDDPYQISCPDC